MMRFVTCTTLLLFFALIALSAGSEGEVVVLTELNWSQQVKTGQWIIEFYAPWCGHCKRLAPIFDEAAKKLHAEKIPVKLGKVDCTSEGSLCSDVQGYPTLKLFREGKMMKEYEGGRTVDSILMYSKRISGPPVQDLTNSQLQDRIKSLRKESETFFLTVGKEGNSYSNFEKTAKQFMETNFVVISKEDKSLSKFNLKEGDVVVFNELNGNEPLKFKGSDKELYDWINAQRHPSFPALTGTNFHTIADSGLPLLVGLIDKDQQSQEIKAALKDIAIEKLKDDERKIIVSTIDAIEHSGFLAEVGVSEVPTVILLEFKKELVYKYNQPNLSRDSIRKFLKDYEEGRVSSSGTGGVAGILRRNFYYIIAAGLLLVVGFGVLIWKFVDDEPLPGHEERFEREKQMRLEEEEASEEHKKKE